MLSIFGLVSCWLFCLRFVFYFVWMLGVSIHCYVILCLLTVLLCVYAGGLAKKHRQRNNQTHPQSNTRRKQPLLTNNYHIILCIYIPFYILYLYFRICFFSAVCICCLTTIFAYTYLLNVSVEFIVTALDIFVFVNHLKMVAKRGRNM
jgi:hypothetical protein